MKKIFILTIAIFIGFGLFANPIPLPTVEISELFFNSDGNWILELGYYGLNQEQIQIDSMFLVSSKDTIILSKYILTGISGFIIITNDSLDSDFHINQYGDTIILKTFIMGDYFEDSLIYGNCQGAIIGIPRKNQSICKIKNYYSKDNSPTIGESNDSTGMCGTLKGTIYDINNNPVKNWTFDIDFPFESLDDGSYSARIYSAYRTLSHLCYYYGPGKRYCPRIINIDYIMEPDSMIYRDVQLLDELIPVEVSIINSYNQDFLFKIFPNPISKSDILKYEFDLPHITANLRLEFLTIDGKLLKVKRISKTFGEIELPISKGLFILQVWLDNVLLSTNCIIVEND